jgi:DNA-binding GntR family transcriptional regulator
MAEEKPISLAENAYIRIRHEILLGKLLPGAVVSERELASRFEMSKTPIREAITQVCREGLMQRLPGRGYLVSPITIKEIHDLFDMRVIIEQATIRKFITKPSPKHLQKLKEISTISYEPDNPESEVEFLEGNREFHLTLAEASGNIRLVQTLESIMIEMERLFHLGLRVGDYSTEMREEHQGLVAAIEEGDLDHALKSIENQVLTSKKRILEAIISGEVQSIQAIG